jgi:DNA-binding NarL/FixJ family response regulator
VTDERDDPIRVVIADDQPMIRLGLRMILDEEPDLVTVGEAGDGTEAVAVARRTGADVLLLDIRMPGTDGIEATRQVRADPALAALRVVVLTTFDDEEYVTGALRAGADAFLLKDTDPGTLVSAVRRVHGGGSLIDPMITALVLDQWRAWGAGRPASPIGGGGSAGAGDALAGLTPREREVLRVVARGASNADAAAELGLSPATIKAYVHDLLTQLGCTARSQLVVVAYEAGLVVPGA